MVLYAADLDDIAPTKKVSRKRKELAETEPEPVESKPEKPKKVLTEKQKEALKKGQETRRLKKEQAEKEKQEQEALQQKLLAAAPKRKKKVSAEIAPAKEEPKPVETPTEPTEPKPKKKRAPRKENVSPSENVSTESVEQPLKKRKKSQDPPEWFTKYVESVQKEKAAAEGEVSKKQENIIKTEALKVAKKSWESGYTRDRVQNEVDNHMNRMYKMIFSR